MSSAILLKISNGVKLTEVELLRLVWQLSHLIISRECLNVSAIYRSVNCQKGYSGDWTEILWLNQPLRSTEGDRHNRRSQLVNATLTEVSRE